MIILVIAIPMRVQWMSCVYKAIITVTVRKHHRSAQISEPQVINYVNFAYQYSFYFGIIQML